MPIPVEARSKRQAAQERMRNALHDILRYSHDIREPNVPRRGTSYGAFEGWLRRELAEHFFSDLYIERAVAQRVRDRLKADSSTYLIHGPRGSGKTTVLLKFVDEYCREYEQTDFYPENIDMTTVVHYVNLRSAVEKLDSDENYTVCDLCVDEIERYLFAQTDEASPTVRSIGSDIEGRYIDYLLANSPHFQQLKKAIDARLAINSDLDRSEVQARYADQIADLYGTYGVLASAKTRLAALLQFTSTDLRHRSIVILDNLDRFSSALHDHVGSKCREIAASNSNVSFVLACRTANIASFMTADSGDDGVVEMSVDEKDQFVVDDDGSDFQRILNARLDLLSTLLRQPEALDDESSREVIASYRALGYSNFGQMIEHYRAVYMKSFSSLHAVLEGDFLKWHNGSIRSALAHFFDLLSCITTGADPLFPRLRNEVAKPIVDSAYQSLIWRALIFGAERPPQLFRTVNVFDGDTAESDFPMQRLWILLFLIENVDAQRYCRRDKLVNFAASLGLNEQALDLHLTSLESWSGFESEGLVRTDKLERGGGVVAAIRLRRAGVMFVERLLFSCEYLFWSALTTENYSNQSIRSLRVADVLQDHVRLQLARDFAVRFVHSGELKAVELGQIRHDRRWLHAQTGTQSREELAVRMLQSLDTFALNADLNETERRQWERQLKQSQERLAKNRVRA